MTFELFSHLGVEGIAIVSLILIASFGLAGFRLSGAGGIGSIAAAGPAWGRMRLRRRSADELTARRERSPGKSRTGQAVKLGKWVWAAVGKEGPQAAANQSMIRFRHADFDGVKEPAVAFDEQPVGVGASDGDACAGVSNSEPQLMDSDKQWTRVNAIVAEGLGKAREIESLHEAAARQLDAVDYAYERMLLELKDVLPAVVEARMVCRTNRDDAYAAVTANPVETTNAAGDFAASAGPSTPVSAKRAPLTPAAGRAQSVRAGKTKSEAA